MAKRSEFLMSASQRQRRSFSHNFKVKKVREIESGQVRISEICKEYEVSTTSVYKWISKYGTMKSKPEKLIVESDSDTKQLVELKRRIADLERIIGQKQVLIDFKDKMIELAEEEYGVDIKKKFSVQPSSTIGKTEKR
jgi:transposase